MITVNDLVIKPTDFPDGTSQVWKLPENLIGDGVRYFNIEWDFDHEDEFMHLAQLVTLLKYARVPIPIRLHLPFLPYGRQDKEVSNESTFALRTFCSLIDSMRFDKVTTLDAHSDVASSLIDNFENIFPGKEISRALRACEATAVAFPDAGAYKRYFSSDVCIGHHYVIGHKERDQLTGYITKYNIEGNPGGKKVLIIDDICDGGMTFRLLAKDLLKAGASEVHLYVTHGIFSRGIKVLKEDGISRIFTSKGEIFPSRQTNYLIREF